MKHLTMILAFLMTLSSPVAAQDFAKGLTAYNMADYATALKEWGRNKLTHFLNKIACPLRLCTKRKCSLNSDLEIISFTYLVTPSHPAKP